jgi:hypothetical protein
MSLKIPLIVASNPRFHPLGSLEKSGQSDIVVDLRIAAGAVLALVGDALPVSVV